MINRFFILAIALVCLISCENQTVESNATAEITPTVFDTLNADLSSYDSLNILPGFAVSIFKADTILFEKGYGYSNIEEKSPYTPESIQIIASATKTLVGVSLMKAVENGSLKLDDNINNYLPSSVINPNYPDEVITPRMLASHTSSISDVGGSDKGYRFVEPLDANNFPEAYAPLLEAYNQSEDLSMEEFLNRKLNSEGDWYDERSFTSFKPGESYEYSNYGIALLALILESLEERSFDEISRSQILEPLGMSASYWKLDEVPDAVHVTYYNELLNEVPNYSIITYPDGGLYSSVSDMRLFIQELMKSYNGEGSLLTEASTRKMMKKQFEGEELYDGLCWDLSFEGLIGHSGNDFGTATLMYFSPETGIGRILFTNISIETEDQEEAFYGIFNTLFGYDLSAY